jgi:ATPase subunit of ABC transporter with duplicated ATPase domains
MHGPTCIFWANLTTFSPPLQALFAGPTLLLLDEPTNHLDLEACVWLEDHLEGYKKCLLVVSHSQDFLNTVCNRIMWLANKQLKFYTGNYAMFTTLTEQELKTQLKVRPRAGSGYCHFLRPSSRSGRGPCPDIL